MISPRRAQLVSMFTFIVSIAEGDKNCNQSVNQCCDGLSSCLFFLRFFAHFASQKTLDISKFLLAVVTLQTFTKVKAIYLGQIHQKPPEVNSSRVLFYLGEKFWEGHITDIGSQGFHTS